MIEAIFQHASAENFFGAVVTLILIALLGWMLKSFTAQQKQIVRAIEVHGALLIGLQLQLLADKPGETEPLRLLLEDVRKKLQEEK